MAKNRPVNIQLSTVKFPITATASILHRISGIITFILLALFLTLLNCSLKSEAHFNQIDAYLDLFIFKFILWAALTALAYHVVFGLRHMIQDLGFCEEIQSASISAKIGFVITTILSILAGCLLW